MKLGKHMKRAYMETANKLKGRERRIFMAHVVIALGDGGQRRAEREFGWNRGTIRKGLKELKGEEIEDKSHLRGRKRAEDHLPNLLTDIREIISSHENVSTSIVRQLLIDHKAYEGSNLPSNETLRRKIRQVTLSRPAEAVS